MNRIAGPAKNAQNVRCGYKTGAPSGPERAYILDVATSVFFPTCALCRQRRRSLGTHLRLIWPRCLKIGRVRRAGTLEIDTLDQLRFPSVLLQPLGHLSVQVESTVYRRAATPPT